MLLFGKSAFFFHPLLEHSLLAKFKERTSKLSCSSLVKHKFLYSVPCMDKHPAAFFRPKHALLLAQMVPAAEKC